MDEHGPDAPSREFTKAAMQEELGKLGMPVSSERKYLPTVAELIDRLTIVQLKRIFIPENAKAYADEQALIEHDLGLVMQVPAEFISAVTMLMLTNRYIWENESKARAGGAEQDTLLKLTHSINGVRNTAKNVIAKLVGDRVDLKVDALAADLPKEYGQWDVFSKK